MKIVFFGTPDYVIPIVDKLHKTFRSKNGGGIVAVVTQTPKPVGRKKELKYSEIDHWAHRKNVKIYHNPISLIQDPVLPQSIGILASYGKIIPKSVIDHFEYGILNVHPSDLPRLRGASPVQATILTESVATVSIIQMDQQLDHGPVVTKFREDIRNDDTTGSLTERLFARSSDVLCELLSTYVSDKITLTSQDHKKATFTKLVKKDDAFIDPEILKDVLDGKKSKREIKIGFIKGFQLPATSYQLHKFIRAMQPWPVAWTLLRPDSIGTSARQAKRLKIIKAHLKDDKLVIDEVQLEGKNPVTWKQFQQAYPKINFN